uniref:Uncharacterized protein n=1 Tax=Candidatus Kentrum sp. SD TaxID=2126332 RepID=A0A450YW48_9GAMM|nr:MAG: hypothetical protein BECKSD772E_GA0070983_10607 [Candidatus Kentron sp. SD]
MRHDGGGATYSQETNPIFLTPNTAPRERLGRPDRWVGMAIETKLTISGQPIGKQFVFRVG